MNVGNRVVWHRLHLATLAFLVGVMLFFSVVLAPLAFRTIPTVHAADLMNRLFPPYHVVVEGCALVALATFWLGAGSGTRGADSTRRTIRASAIRPILLALLVVLSLYAGLVLSPEASGLRAELKQAPPGTASPASQARFTQLHRRSVALNGALLLGAVTVLGWAIVLPPRPPP